MSLDAHDVASSRTTSPENRYQHPLLAPAPTRLRVSYRITAQNLGYATAILDGVTWVDSEDLDDDLYGYHSVRRGPALLILHIDTKAEEAMALAGHITEWIATRDAAGDDTGAFSVGVLTRTNQRKTEIATQLAELGVPLSPSGATDSERPVAVVTKHNTKGLGFTHVILSDVNAGALPQRYLRNSLA